VDERRVGVIGATSLVGEFVLSRLKGEGRQTIAFTRQQVSRNDGKTEWRRLAGSLLIFDTFCKDSIEQWIFLAPIWVLPDYFDFLKAHGARRVVALSSTSRFSKSNSPNKKERALAQVLEEGERRLQVWADENEVEWVVLRPTMIYGRDRDKNLSTMAHFISRFGFFPLLGKANGMRQPVHASDVAQASVAALYARVINNNFYNLSGGEILSYRDMVVRVFAALGRKPRLMVLPLGLFKLAVACLRCLPRYRNFSIAMAERMQQDLVFDHTEAVRDLGFAPKLFQPTKEDFPA
jgi:nucleoside-diphosphate-sugar epimerase